MNFRKIILYYCFGWLLGVNVYMLFIFYWTLRKGFFIVREPNTFILIFEIINIILMVFFSIYIAQNYLKKEVLK